MKRIAVFAVLTAFAAAVAGCGELDQTARYEDGKYRGKSDSRPWDNAPLAYVPGAWDKGDHTTWEKQIRARSEGQNEHRRIGH